MSRAKRAMSLAQLRNLPQYRGKTEEELEKIQHAIINGDTDDRIEDIIKSFEKDFDLSDMTANDLLSLQELAKIFLHLEDLGKQLHTMMEAEDADWTTIDRVNRVAAQLRGDASSIQKDLNITRKFRQESKGQSVVDFIEDIKSRGKKFLQMRLSEIYCTKCNMLLCKAWFLYPEEDNKVELICKKCKKELTVSSKELLERRNKNIEIGPPI